MDNGEKNTHEDLRRAAVESVANYMHHCLFDILPVNMLEWIRGQADTIIGICDIAIENTKAEGKRRGIL